MNDKWRVQVLAHIFCKATRAEPDLETIMMI